MIDKENLRVEIKNLDDSIINAIIECCKEILLNGVPLHEWDKDTVLVYLDKALEQYD